MVQPGAPCRMNKGFFFSGLDRAYDIKVQGCLAGSVGRACDSYLGVMSLSPILGVEITGGKKKQQLKKPKKIVLNPLIF